MGEYSRVGFVIHCYLYIDFNIVGLSNIVKGTQDYTFLIINMTFYLKNQYSN